MNISKAVTRPILVVMLAAGWLAMILMGTAVPEAYEMATSIAIGWFFLDRSLTHRLGDKK